MMTPKKKKRAPIVGAEPPALPTGELPSGKPQRIEIAGQRMVVMPVADYEVLIEAARDNIEDLADAADAIEILRRIERGEESTLPADVVMRLRRESRIKVLREHRGLTQAQLGESIGSDRLYISQLETGVRGGSVDTLSRIAAVLDVPIDLVAPKPHDVSGEPVARGLRERKPPTYRSPRKPKGKKR
jgi:DNA-binding XRE family transcriptional regulator